MTPSSQTKIERLFFWGRPFSPLYSFLMAKRSSLYEKNIFKRHKLEVPVISVGNLVLGGTGKTPLVHYIAKLLKKKNKRPAILSRGYKGASTGPINIVSDGNNILIDAEQAGDEPRLLAEKLPGVPIITGKKRSITGRFAIDTYGVSCLILDDGFQHMSLMRDLDLVLFSAEKLLENNRVLPGGFLREPLTALKRADAFIISGVKRPDDSRITEFINYLHDLFPDTPVFTGTYQPDEKIYRMSAGNNDTISIAECRKIPVYGFCGIAQPESFYNLLRNNGLNVVGFESFDDHHAYSLDNIKSLCENGLSCGAQALITTEKDLVKVRALLPQDLPLLTLGLKLQMDKSFDHFLLRSLENFRI
ncbi:MAG: tetraacyldisaccharide 4'-kinase [Deltaproteobacteria bacterium]|jgi:tetraacyldisaccharide 4'-kinase|nr:tetraacyldisaccharide 4'-kinase [Deltaproteobacteria bacterium]